ncbi:MAG: procyclic acidic repetitive family protein [Clostridia bacterium]|nr:procyclic acidic repetitive family protein [Clostridia bacterium]
MLKRVFSACLVIAVFFSTVIGVNTSFASYTSLVFETDGIPFGYLGYAGASSLDFNSMETDIQGVVGKFGTWSYALGYGSTGTVEFRTEAEAEAMGSDLWGMHIDTTGLSSHNIYVHYDFADKLAVGHQYYIAFEVNETNNHANNFAVVDKNNSNELMYGIQTGMSTASGFTNSVVNTWSRKSLCFNGRVTSSAGNQANRLRICLQDYSSSGGGSHWFRNFVFIDLTSTFGKGLEPTQAWCDKYLSSSIGEELGDIIEYIQPVTATSFQNKALMTTGNYQETAWSEDGASYFHIIRDSNVWTTVTDDEVTNGLTPENQALFATDGAAAGAYVSKYFDTTGYYFQKATTTNGSYTTIMFSNRRQSDMVASTVTEEEKINGAKSFLNPDHMYYYAVDVRMQTSGFMVQLCNMLHYVPSDGSAGSGLFYHSPVDFKTTNYSGYIDYGEGEYAYKYAKVSDIFSGGLTSDPTTITSGGNQVTLPAGGVDGIRFGVYTGNHTGNVWLRDFVLVDLTMYFGSDDNIPSVEWCDQYLTYDTLVNNRMTVAAAMALLEEDAPQSGIELEDGMIAGTSIDIVEMPNMTAINQMAIEEAPEGYEFYGWHIRSDFASMTLEPEDAEYILGDVYYDGEPYPLTLTAVYIEKPSDEVSPEPSAEPEETQEPEVSEEPTATETPVEDLTPAESEEPTPSEPIETPEPSEDTTEILIDATEVLNIDILEIGNTFQKGDDILLTFQPLDGYDVPDTIKLYFDGEEVALPVMSEDGETETVRYENGVLTISGDVTENVSVITIKATAPEYLTETVPEPSPEPSPEVGEETSEPTESDKSDLDEKADELTGEDIDTENGIVTDADTSTENESGEGVEEPEQVEIDPVISQEELVTTLPKEEEEEEEDNSDEPAPEPTGDGSDSETEAVADIPSVPEVSEPSVDETTTD